MKAACIIAAALILLAPTHTTAAAKPAHDTPFSYANYAAVLKTHLDKNALVDYRSLKANSKNLDAFLKSLEKLDPEKYETWPDNKKIALWLNAYNACTLKAIIDNYPIKSSFLRSRLYPKNSIRQIKGVWDKTRFTIMNRTLTLERIEHEILRKQFEEPRIHMALVCAAMGCPPLRNKPYTAKNLDAQLADQSREFLQNPKKFTFDPKKKIIHISPIFKWFARDFTTPAGPDKDKNTAILNFTRKHLAPSHPLNADPNVEYKIQYLKYDWSLNEQPPKRESAR